MEQPKYTMKVAANLAGLTPYVIRAWEKRYAVVDPERTDTNRRLYTNEQVEYLRLLRRLTEAGYPIGSIAGMEAGALRKLLETEDSQQRRGAEGGGTAEAQAEMRGELLRLARALDPVSLERLLVEGSVLFSHRELLEGVVIPFIDEVGRSWKSGSLRIAHEHVATSAVRNMLTNLLYTARTRETEHALVVSTPSGQAHELGALISANIAVMSGWDVTYLGADLPAGEIAASARDLGASVVLLSIVFPPDDPLVHSELAKLAGMLPPETSIVIGGRSAGGYRQTIERVDGCVLESIDHLWDYLDRRRREKTGCFA
jgi:DNA-binding transcriptional MerR regulator/methylmalonyl-CoA mutase cobalamin-binding subunit